MKDIQQEPDVTQRRKLDELNIFMLFLSQLKCYFYMIF